MDFQSVHEIGVVRARQQPSTQERLDFGASVSIFLAVFCVLSYTSHARITRATGIDHAITRTARVRDVRVGWGVGRECVDNDRSTHAVHTAVLHTGREGRYSEYLLSRDVLFCTHLTPTSVHAS